MPSANHEAGTAVLNYLIIFAYRVAPCVGLSDVDLYAL